VDGRGDGGQKHFTVTLIHFTRMLRGNAVQLNGTHAT
jgi:hypothetical protein